MAKNGADILKEATEAANEKAAPQIKKMIGEAVEKVFSKKVVSFSWDGGNFVASEAEVLVEGTIVIKFPVWYAEQKGGKPTGTDPYKHSAALSPRLSEMKNVEFSSSAVKCDSFTVKP
jgi:hypothetical protein